MGIDIDIQTEKIENSLVVFLNGELDQHNSKKIIERIEKDYREYDCKNMIVDFGAVGFMDSSGIGLVLGRYKFLKARNGELVCCNLSKEASRVFDTVAMFKILNIKNDVSESLVSLR